MYRQAYLCGWLSGMQGGMKLVRPGWGGSMDFQLLVYPLVYLICRDSWTSRVEHTHYSIRSVLILCPYFVTEFPFYTLFWHYYPKIFLPIRKRFSCITLHNRTVPRFKADSGTQTNVVWFRRVLPSRVNALGYRRVR